MQQTTPFHRDNYSRLILSVIIQFYQRCYDRFRDLVSVTEDGTDEARLAIAARWAQKPEVAACVSALYSSPVSFIPYASVQMLNVLQRMTICSVFEGYVDRKQG